MFVPETNQSGFQLFLDSIYEGFFVLYENGGPKIVAMLLIAKFAHSMYQSGVYHISVSFALCILFDFVGIRVLSLSAITDVYLAGSLQIILCYVFFDWKKFNIPVYLARKTKKTSCNIRFGKWFGLSDHWAVVTANPNVTNHYFIFDVHGIAPYHLFERKTIRAKEDLLRRYRGFYPVGLTSQEASERFLHKNLKITISCQQYCHLAANYLVYPCANLSYTFGRFSYFLLIAIFAVLVVSNHIFSFQVDIDTLFFLYMVFETSSMAGDFEDIERRSNNATLFDVIGCKTTFIALSLWGDYIRFNGYVTLICTAMDLLLSHVFLPILIPAFSKKNASDKQVVNEEVDDWGETRTKY